jgi:hypothetical protein
MTYSDDSLYQYPLLVHVDTVTVTAHSPEQQTLRALRPQTFEQSRNILLGQETEPLVPAKERLHPREVGERRYSFR